jgi:selenocysteine lyase/cysteine desulfurase
MVIAEVGITPRWTQIRDDFPVLAQTNARGQRLAFLDSAASSQKPVSVIETLDRYYRETNANIHRGVYDLSERATAQYEAARDTVATSSMLDPRAKSSSCAIQLRPSIWLRMPGAGVTSKQVT